MGINLLLLLIVYHQKKVVRLEDKNFLSEIVRGV